VRLVPPLKVAGRLSAAPLNMPGAIMDIFESFFVSSQKRCDYYRQKIADHTPPKSDNDARMICIYQRLLTRDGSFLSFLFEYDMVYPK
jgi:hypothetical protein